MRLSNQDIVKLADQILASLAVKPTKIIGIATGGEWPAKYLARRLGVPFEMVQYSLRDADRKSVVTDLPIRTVPEGEMWLIVDDIVETGQTLRDVTSRFQGDVSTAVLVAFDDVRNACHVPNHIGLLVSTRVGYVYFPWETEQMVKHDLNAFWEQYAALKYAITDTLAFINDPALASGQDVLKSKLGELTELTRKLAPLEQQLLTVINGPSLPADTRFASKYGLHELVEMKDERMGSQFMGSVLAITFSPEGVIYTLRLPSGGTTAMLESEICIRDVD